MSSGSCSIGVSDSGSSAAAPSAAASSGSSRTSSAVRARANIRGFWSQPSAATCFSISRTSSSSRSPRWAAATASTSTGAASMTAGSAGTPDPVGSSGEGRGTSVVTTVILPPRHRHGPGGHGLGPQRRVLHVTFDAPSGVPGPGGRPDVGEPARRNRALLWTLVVLAVLAFSFILVSGFVTDLFWYQSVDASSVFTTQLWTKLGLLLFFGGLMAVVVGVNMWIAYRFRPVFRLMSPEQASLERYRMALDPIRRVAMIGIPLLLGLLAGVSATAGVEGLAALPQRHVVRHDRPDLQRRRRLLRLHAAVPALRRRLPVRRGRARVHRGRRRALRLRRHPACSRPTTGSAGPRRRSSASSSASSCCSRRSPTGSTATTSRSRPTTSCPA